jgi:hypothetical protein
MNPGESLPLEGATEEVSALVKTLLETGQRLEKLTFANGTTLVSVDGDTIG